MKEKSMGRPHCNITPVLALKSPTSIILILIQICIIVSGLRECIFLLNGFEVTSIFPAFKLIVEGPGSWFGMDDAGVTEVRAIGSEVFGSVMMTDTAEVFWAINLTMPFCFAVTTGNGRAPFVSTTRVDPGFFRLGSDR